MYLLTNIGTDDDLEYFILEAATILGIKKPPAEVLKHCLFNCIKFKMNDASAMYSEQ